MTPPKKSGKGKGKAASGSKRGRPKAKRPNAGPKPKKRTDAEKAADGKAVVKAAQPEHVADIPLEELLGRIEEEQDKVRRIQGVKMSALERYERDGQIYRGFLRGLMPDTLAQTFELSVKQIERIVSEWKKRAVAAAKQGPEEIIEEHVLRLDSLIDELAAHSAREKGTGRTAAIRARLEAMSRRIEFLQSVGVLPRDLGQIGIQIDLRSMAEQLYRALEKRGLAEPDLLGELADIIDGKVIEGTAEEIPLKDDEEIAEPV